MELFPPLQEIAAKVERQQTVPAAPKRVR